MNKAMRLAILECYEEEREFVVLDTLEAAGMRLGYYLEVFKHELKRGLTCK